MIMPGLLVLVIFFLVPMVRLAQLAFYQPDPIWIYKPAFTLTNFAKFFSDPFYWGMIFNSLRVGLLTTVCTLLVGYPIAYYLSLSRGTERTILTAGFMLPLFVTMLVGTLGWYILFLPFGLVQRILQSLGLVSGPLRVLKTFTALVVVLGYLHLPYALLILVSSIQSVPREKIDAARTLGAPTWMIFLKIVLPLTMPGITSSAILVFALSSSSYLVPVLITGQSIPLLPIAIWRYTNETLNWPFAAANALILFAITIVVMYGLILLTNRISRRGKWEVV